MSMMKIPEPTETERPAIIVDGMLRPNPDIGVEMYLGGKWIPIENIPAGKVNFRSIFWWVDWTETNPEPATGRLRPAGETDVEMYDGEKGVLLC